MHTVHFDYETYSDVSVVKVGAYRYATHPSTIVLCMYYAIDEHEPVQYLPPGIPFKQFKNFRFAAHNSQFEWCIWKYVCVPKYGWPEPPPLKQWLDTAALARYYGLPGALDKCAKALHLKYKKDAVGHRIMLKLSRPRKPSAANPDKRWTPETKPDDFQKLYSYCSTDVEVEREIHARLGELPPIEQRIWIQNERLNRRGIRCDLGLAKRVLRIKEYHQEVVNSRIEELTSGDITKATQTARLTEFLGVPSLAKEELNNRIRTDFSELQNELMDLRLSASGSSTAKFEAMINCACDDGRLRGMFMYHAASQTGRFGGSLIQPHNLPRPELTETEIQTAIECISAAPNVQECYEFLLDAHGDPIKALKSLIRAALRAENNKSLVVSDFASVEARKLAWISGCRKLINIYKKGGSPYIDMAESLFKKKIDKEKNYYEYFVGKQTILGAGYGMSGSRFKGECDSRGIEISEEFASKAIRSYRDRYPEIPSLWWAVNKAAIAVIQEGGAKTVGRCTFMRRAVPFDRLVCTLPSGREMSYPYPSVRMVWPPWESDTKIPQIFYWTVKPPAYRWTCVSTYGGSIVENICQASTRDILCSRMLKLERKNFPMVIHVHDEVGAEIRDAVSVRGQRLLDKIMSEAPPWCPGLPLKSEGYIAKRYKK